MFKFVFVDRWHYDPALTAAAFNELDAAHGGLAPTESGLKTSATHIAFASDVDAAAAIVAKVEYSYFSVPDESSMIAELQWISSKPGHGSALLAALEQHLVARNINKLRLSCCADESELASTVLRRINFYIKNQFRVFGVKYTDRRRVVLLFEKKLNESGKNVCL